MDKCRHIQDLLADYRSGVLGARRSGEIERHLAECAECAAELKLLDDVLALVDSNTPQSEPPIGLWNGVYNRITDPEPTRAAFGTRVRAWIARPAHAAGVGMATLALVLGLTFGGVHHNPSPPVTIAANDEYIQGHALYASQAPFADSVSYISLVTGSESKPGDAK